jgi:tetratricopeptide (TPR) repeat protein
MYILPVFAKQEQVLAPGTWVLVLKHPLEIHTLPTADSPVSGVIPGGTRSRIVATEGGMFYLADNVYGWVVNTYQNQPTLTRYTPEAVDTLIHEVTAKINIDAKDVDSLVIRCIAYASRRKFDKALPDCNAAVDQSFRDGTVYDYRGKVYLDEGNFTAARDDVQGALSRGVLWASTINRMGTIYDRMGQTQDALDEFLKSTTAELTFGLAYANAALMYKKLNETQKAFQFYEKASLFDPQLSVAYSGRGYLFQGRGDADSALREVNEGIKADPYSADLYIARGGFYGEMLRDYQKAETDFRHAHDLDPESSYPYSALGVNYLFQGQIEPAITNLQRAISMNSTDETAYYNLAYIYAVTGRYAESVEAYTHAAEAGSTYHVHVLIYRSQVYIALKQYKQAEDDINHFLPCTNCRKDFVTVASFVRGEARLYQERYAEALQDYQLGFATNADFAKSYATVGAGYRSTQQRQKLISDLQAQIALHSTSQLHRELAIMYMEQGEWENAVTSFRGSLELEPNAQLQQFVDDFEMLIEK